MVIPWWTPPGLSDHDRGRVSEALDNLRHAGATCAAERFAGRGGSEAPVEAFAWAYDDGGEPRCSGSRPSTNLPTRAQVAVASGDFHQPVVIRMKPDETKLDVSEGTPIRFTAAGKPCDAYVLKSNWPAGDSFIEVIVALRKGHPVEQGAQLKVPELPENVGCGVARIAPREGHPETLVLSIPNSYVEGSTIGQ